MNKKIFIAIDTRSTLKATHIIRKSRVKNFKIGYKFGLEFINSKKGRKFISSGTLSKGSLVVFPSFVWHRVKKVTKGTRYSLVIWSCGWPFK